MKKINNIKKYILLFCIISVITLLSFIMFTLITKDKKLVCVSNKGEITLYYDKNKIKKYEVINMEYDLKEQNEYAKTIGIDKYLKEFENWFKENSTGKCQKK